MITGMTVFPSYLARLEREDGLPRIVIGSPGDASERVIDFAEDAYSLWLEPNRMYDAQVLRFAYASMTTPRETYDYDLATGTRRLRKRQTIPSGHNPARYVTRRLFAETSDGERVPITVLHAAGFERDGDAPLLLYGYGAYGHALPASFSANALSAASSMPSPTSAAAPTRAGIGTRTASSTASRTRSRISSRRRSGSSPTAIPAVAVSSRRVAAPAEC